MKLAVLLLSCCSAYAEGNLDTTFGAVADRLNQIGDEMMSSHRAISMLDSLRSSLISGGRPDLPSAQRQYLASSEPRIDELTFDARHHPISTNVSRHFLELGVVASTSNVRFYTFLPLKRQTSNPGRHVGPPALVLVIDENWKLFAYDPDDPATVLMGPIDLGHGPDAVVTQMKISPSQEHHFVVTADSLGRFRVHSLRVVAKRDAPKDGVGSRLSVTANFTSNFSLPVSTPKLELTTLLPVERAEKMYFAAGDSSGGISVFMFNGTLKGRVKVTEDPGGVLGLVAGSGMMVVFYSAYTFGTFSPSQVDVQSATCSGWNSPAYDAVVDPSYQNSRVILSLENGDIIGFTTTRGKNKACDLTLKFPALTSTPTKLQIFRGHVMALTSPLESDPHAHQRQREIFFFNLALMDAGYGPTDSNVVTLQATFAPKQPVSIELAAMFGPAGTIDRKKALCGVRFQDEPGVSVFTMSLRLPAAVQAVVEATYAGEEDDSWWGWLTGWFPKVGIFGLVLAGVVAWNMRKMMGGNDEFDESFFREQLKLAQASQKRQGGGGAGTGKFNSGGGGLGGLDMDD